MGSTQAVRRRARLALEARTAALGAAVRALAWLLVLATAGTRPAAWVGLGLGAAYVVLLTLEQLLIFNPLRRRVQQTRSELSQGAARVKGGRMAELDGLLGALTTMSQAQGDDRATLQHDLLRLQTQHHQLLEVAQIGQEINAALPYRETVDRALARAKRFLRADFVALLLRDPDTGGFSLEGALGVRSRSLDADCCRERDDCPLKHAAISGQTVRTTGHQCSLFPHTMTHQLSVAIPADDEGAQMVLLATSTSGERLDVITDEALETLRGHLRQALTNARKYDSIRRQVVTDHLTRLYNRRYFVNRVAEELTRSLREQSPMSVVMVDIDHFKRFNDTYGHATGDRVLQAVAATLQDAVRTSDVCARHGGEEFVLLLPATPGENAVFMAERVRRTLGGTRYTGLGLPPDASITISCGVATCPRDATQVDELLELADQALYRAKAQGRDCVCQYEPAVPAEASEGKSGA